MSASSRIAAADRIPLGQKVAFALGQNTDYVATILLKSVVWMPFFNIGLGLSPVVLGVVLMVLCAWTAFGDPDEGRLLPDCDAAGLHNRSTVSKRSAGSIGFAMWSFMPTVRQR